MRKKVFVLSMIILLITVIIETLFIVTYLHNKPEQEPVKTMSEDPGYSVIRARHTLDSGLDIWRMRVYIKDNEELENKVNESLTKYFYLLVEPFISESATEVYPPIVHLQSPRYLSVEYSFKYLKQYAKKESPEWHLCVTVDMQSGEVVFLDDLLEIDEDFAELVKNGRIFRINGNDYITAQILTDKTVQELNDEVNDTFSKMEIDSILFRFNQYTEEFLYGKYYMENGHNMFDIAPSVYLNYFYLDDEGIYFAGVDSGAKKSIRYEDLKGHLKVSLP